MTDTKHTPGPWEITHRVGECPYPHRKIEAVYIINEHSEAHYVEDMSDAKLHGTIRANAKLIAAAPDLLQALEGMTNLFSSALNDQYKAEDFEQYKAAQAAITKATA